jgi:hypothetical protein
MTADNGTPTPSPLAAGRLHVNPGDTIASTWGNSVFDQSVNQFASIADRDAQWASPPDGALCYTASEKTLWARLSGAWLRLIPQGVKARAYRQAAWTSGGGSAAIVFDTASYDPLGLFNLTNGRFTAPVAGDYLAIASASLITNATNQNANLQFWVSGATVLQGAVANQPNSGAGMQAALSEIVPMTAGQYLELHYSAPSGLSGETGTTRVYLSVRLLA